MAAVIETVKCFLEIGSFSLWLQELMWKPEDITGIDADYEVLPDGTTSNGWRKWKRGKHVDITLERDQERVHQTFVVADDGTWIKKEN